MAIYVQAPMLASRIIGGFTDTGTSGVLELYDNCSVLIMTNVTNFNVGNTTTNGHFAILEESSPITMAAAGLTVDTTGILFDVAATALPQRLSLSIGVESDRVGGHYLHMWGNNSGVGADDVYVNVVQLMRNTP